MSPIGKIKQSLQNYLERLGKSNDKEFGGKTPDCCSMNKNEQPGSDGDSN